MRKEKIDYTPTLDDLEGVSAELARRDFLEFILFTKPDFQVNWHHEYIAQKLQDFVDGNIKNLMVFLPTQVGKSEMATRRLPAYILGKYPDSRVAICSYSGDRAEEFSADVQRIIDSPQYERTFPETKLSNGHDGYKRTKEKFDVVKHNGYLAATGIGGLLNGISADWLILDDTVKNRQEAVSLAIQKRNNGWWDSVAKLRLDNNGQILIVNTRWDEDDLAGYIFKANEFDFETIVFPAVKVDDNNPDDPRQIGEALWPEKHSRERYEAQKKANPVVFEALQQQNPGVPTEILVYPKPWKQIERMPDYSRFYGLDLGFSTSPDCLVECQLDGNRAFFHEIFYNTGNDTDTLAIKIKAAGAESGPIYVDKSNPRLIEDLQKRGINAQPAVGGPGSLGAGILFMQSLDIHVTADSTNAWMEKKKYQYPTGPDNLPVPGADPIKNFDHFMDAGRYGVYSYATIGGIAIYESTGDFY